MHIENIHAAKAKLSHLVKRALAGEEIIIARAGEPLVRLTPCRDLAEPRSGGQWRGQVWMADNFDAYDASIAELFAGETE